MLPFAGVLEQGESYRAKAIFRDPPAFEIAPAVKIPPHHAARLEWSNLDKFPALAAQGRGTSLSVVFRVLSKTVARQGSTRWNTEYLCEIRKVE